MNRELERAKRRLSEGSYTCVLCKNEREITSRERGVKPLIDMLCQDCEGFCAADRVVGKGAAFIYVLLKVDAVYAEVLSEPAREVLLLNNIAVSFGTLVPAIKNRKGDGFCPIESAVMSESDPHRALDTIKRTLKSLS